VQTTTTDHTQGGCIMRRHLWRFGLTTLLLLSLVLSVPQPLTAQAASMAEILSQIEKIPHDPNLLGAGPARTRIKEFSAPFVRTEFKGLDGTPLVAAMAIHQDGKPRPGVVLAHGFTGSKNQKYIVELSSLLYGNGWHVLALDLRGHGDSRQLSQALITSGWKEADDILAGAKVLRDESKATSVAILGFSMGGLSTVKAMIKDQGQLLQAGMVFGAPIGEPTPLRPPDPKVPPDATERGWLDFLKAPSLYDYYERSARSYGVTREFLEGEFRADTTIAAVKAPLLLVYAFDDAGWLRQLRLGRHEGGSFSLRYRDAVKEHPQFGTLLVDRGGHAGLLYVSDRHWFGTMVLTYLKYWQAPQAEHVTLQTPTVEPLLEGKMGLEAATYRMVVRNHGNDPVTNLNVSISLPPEAKVLDCWAGMEGLNPCRIEADKLTWTIPKLSGGKSTAGPFVAVLGTASLQPGKVDVKAWLDMPQTIVQEVTLEKK
jgi:pimeloyl-ACP methyl ester carboxylesterase